MITREDVYASMGLALLGLSADAEGLDYFFCKSYWSVLTGQNNPEFNVGMVIPSDFPEKDERVLIDLITRLRNYGYPSLILIPDSQNLDKVAEEQGLNNEGQSPLMGLDATKTTIGVPNNSWRIELVVNMGQLGNVISIQHHALGFERSVIEETMGEKVLKNPNVQIFIAYDQDYVPIGTATFVLDGDITTIWNVGVLPEYQKRGLGTEMMLWAMQTLFRSGSERFYLISTDAGIPLYEKVGFETICNIANWGIK